MNIHADAVKAIGGMLLALPHLNEDFVESMILGLRATMHERLAFEKNNPGQELDSTAETIRYLMTTLSKPQIEVIYKL